MATRRTNVVSKRRRTTHVEWVHSFNDVVELVKRYRNHEQSNTFRLMMTYWRQRQAKSPDLTSIIFIPRPPRGPVSPDPRSNLNIYSWRASFSDGHKSGMRAAMGGVPRLKIAAFVTERCTNMSRPQHGSKQAQCGARPAEHVTCTQLSFRC